MSNPNLNLILNLFNPPQKSHDPLIKLFTFQGSAFCPQMANDIPWCDSVKVHIMSLQLHVQVKTHMHKHRNRLQIKRKGLTLNYSIDILITEIVSN